MPADQSTTTVRRSDHDGAGGAGRQARGALDAPAGITQTTGWRDMSTAPRDGSQFLMSFHYRGAASFVTIASAPSRYATRCAWWRTHDGCVPVVETHPPDIKHRCYATGWQPLPDPLEVEDGN